MSNTNTNPDVEVHVHSSGLAIMTRINDVIVSQSPGHPVNDSAIVNPWVVTGANTLTVYLDKPAVRFAVPAPEYRIVVQTTGVNRAGTPILQYTWPNAQQPADNLPAENPESVRSFELTIPGLGPWAWTRSPAVPLNHATERALVDAFQPIYAAFSAKDTSAIVRLASLRDSECAKAWGTPESQYRTQVQADWDNTFSSPGFSPVLIDPFDRGSFLFHGCWQNRVYQLTTLSGEPPLATNPDADGLILGYDVYLGYVNGAWTWVR